MKWIAIALLALTVGCKALCSLCEKGSPEGAFVGESK